LESLTKNSPKLPIRYGFCKTLKNIKGEINPTHRQKNVFSHLMDKCENKYFNPSIKKNRLK